MAVQLKQHTAGEKGRGFTNCMVEIGEPLTPNNQLACHFLAHLSRRLTGELIGYPWIRRPSVRRPFTFSNISSEPLGQSKPNFMWSLLGKGERKFV